MDEVLGLISLSYPIILLDPGISNIIGSVQIIKNPYFNCKSLSFQLLFLSLVAKVAVVFFPLIESLISIY